MKTSEQINEVVSALSRAQAAFTVVPKNKTAKVRTKTGGEYSYKYADLADVLSMALPKLTVNGLAFSQPHIMTDGKLRVVSMLLHQSGQWIQSDGIEISEAGDPQQFGAESTYFRRYDACSLLGIAPDEDTDAQQAGDRQRREPAKYEKSPEPEKPKLPNEHPGNDQRKEWADAFAECTTVEEFNSLVLPLMKERSKEFVVAAAGEAKRRGYTVNRTDGTYAGGAK